MNVCPELDLSLTQNSSSLAAIGGIAFWFTFRDLDRNEEILNEIPSGHCWPRGIPAEVLEEDRALRTPKAQL